MPEKVAIGRFLLLPSSGNIDKRLLDASNVITEYIISDDKMEELTIASKVISLNKNINSLICEFAKVTVVFTDAVANILKQNPHITQFTIRNIKGIQNDIIGLLAPQLSHIKVLNLSGISNLTPLIYNSFPKLEVLNLRDSVFTLQEKTYSFDMPNLKQIVLPELSPCGANFMMKLLENVNLSHFDSGSNYQLLNYSHILSPNLKSLIIGNFTSEIELLRILQFLASENCSVEHLTIKNIALSSKQCLQISEMLYSTESLLSLVLNNVYLEDKHFKKIASALGSHLRIKEIDFGCNAIGVDTVKKLSESLMVNLRMETIILDHAKLDHSSLKHFFSAPHPVLKKLSMVKCSIQEDCVDLIVSFIKNSKSLEVFDLSHNKLVGKGIKQITDAADKNVYLKHLDLRFVY